MLLSPAEAEMVLKLHGALMQFVIKRLKPLDVHASALSYIALPAEERQKVVRAFLGRMDLVDAFIAATPARLSRQELEIVSSWRHLVFGRFIALRQLKTHMLLLSCDGASTAYALTGLIEPIEMVIKQPLPTMIETVLLPFRGKIIYDGVISRFNVTFGSGSRRGFEEHLRAAKASNGFFTSLPASVAARTAQPAGESPKPKLDRRTQLQVPTVRQVLTRIVGMTNAFCEEHLTEEYANLCRNLAEKLAGKRPSPLLRGKLESWACGIIRTIGWVNFLDDQSQSPHLKLPMIDRAF